LRTTADGVRYEFMSERVRKLIFIGIVAIGALVGLLSAVHDDWATRVVMVAVGALFGCAIGGALAFAGRSTASPPQVDGSIPGMGSSTADIAVNYWRDKGSPPFMKAPSAQPDKHMFDPDKLG
jgi:hypothetical protein